MSLYVKNPAKLERTALKVHVKFPRERERECDHATILYFIFSRKKEARERGCRALLASGPRAEVIPTPHCFPFTYALAPPRRNLLFLQVCICDIFASCARGSSRNLCIETSPVATLVASCRPRSREKATLIMIVKFHDDERRFQPCAAMFRASQKFAMPFATAINDARSSAVGVCRVTGRESVAPRSRKCPSTVLLSAFFPSAFLLDY